MIGRRGFPALEPPRALAGSARPAPVPRTCHRMRIASRQGPRAPPDHARCRDFARASGTERQRASVTDRDAGPRYGAGPAEAPLAQANQAPPESNGVSL